VRKFDSAPFIIDHVGMGVDRAALPNQLQTTIDQLLFEEGLLLRLFGSAT
jgi:hypothetical protein